MKNITPTRMAREAAGLSVEELAYKSGVAYETIRNIERGKASRSDTLILICDVLKISIDEYIGRKIPE